MEKDTYIYFDDDDLTDVLPELNPDIIEQIRKQREKEAIIV